jgi:hypothetical protein
MGEARSELRRAVSQAYSCAAETRTARSLAAFIAASQATIEANEALFEAAIIYQDAVDQHLGRMSA